VAERLRVKICGMNSVAAVEAAAEAGADWIGFVFFPRSPRAVTPEQAARLSAHAPAADHRGAPQRVGLFVEPTDAEIAGALEALKLDTIQLYTDGQRAAAIRTRFGVPVWRAVGVALRDDLPVALQGSDALLLDAKAPVAAPRPGGNAQAFDWSMLTGWTAPGPWILAGGLTPANVAAAVRASGAPAVDVSSGVERAPGVKDAELIRAFVAAARAA
jgi:phosphoribosylanthranilate isomerase